jgi:hypothetical protein
MAVVTTRQTADANATVKGSPLTNAEMDNNFIAVNNEVIQASVSSNTIAEQLRKLKIRIMLGI